MSKWGSHSKNHQFFIVEQARPKILFTADNGRAQM